jgi:dienelactone hydrolase
VVTAVQERAARLPSRRRAPYHARMRTSLVALVLLAITTAALARDAVRGDPADDGPFKARKVELTVAHADGKTTPLEVFLPARADRPRPVVLFVHGFWVGPEVYRRTAENLATRGYAVAMFDQFDRSTNDLPGWVAGARLALDTLERAPALKGQLDLERLGVMGHSYGGMTTLGVAAVDSRVKAAVALAPGAQSAEELMRFARSIQDVPVLVITTENDTTCPGDAWGRVAWDAIPSTKKLYVEVARGDHATQSDLPSLAGHAPRRTSRRDANAWLDRWVLGAPDPLGLTDGRAAARDPELSDRATAPGIATAPAKGRRGGS